MKKKLDKTIIDEMVTERTKFTRIVRRENNNFLLFLEKTGFNIHIASQYGYALLEKALYNIIFANKGKNVLFLAIMSTTGAIYYKLIDRSYIFSLFLKFLNECKNENFFNFNYIIIMDNVRIYHSKKIKYFFIDNIIKK